VKLSSRLPDFLVKDLQRHPLSSADLLGKVVLVDFWATLCQACKKEMPAYQKLADHYGARGFVVIGLKFDTTPDIIAQRPPDVSPPPLR
jgi:thiol-disulfide isomerase/thioredoxin